MLPHENCPGPPICRVSHCPACGGGSNVPRELCASCRLVAGRLGVSHEDYAKHFLFYTARQDRALKERWRGHIRSVMRRETPGLNRGRAGCGSLVANPVATHPADRRLIHDYGQEWCDPCYAVCRQVEQEGRP